MALPHVLRVVRAACRAAGSIRSSEFDLLEDGSCVTGKYKTHYVETLVDIRLENGEGFRGTLNHPVWSEDQQDWINLDELRVGENIGTAFGPISVSSIEFVSHRAPVYNIEVHREHVYEITDSKVLVHNGGLSEEDCAELELLRIRQENGTLSNEDRENKGVRSHCFGVWGVVSLANA